MLSALLNENVRSSFSSVMAQIWRVAVLLHETHPLLNSCRLYVIVLVVKRRLLVQLSADDDARGHQAEKCDLLLF